MACKVASSSTCMATTMSRSHASIFSRSFLFVTGTSSKGQLSWKNWLDKVSVGQKKFFQLRLPGEIVLSNRLLCAMVQSLCRRLWDKLSTRTVLRRIESRPDFKAVGLIYK